MVHDRIRDMVCDRCNYTCSTNGDLKQHKKMVHDRVRDIKCDRCNYTCSIKCSLKTHIKAVHLRPAESKRMSLGEFKINTILKKFSIKFTQEKKFDDLISDKGGNLRFDFAIPNNDSFLLIEFDGIQHFKKIRWSSEDSEKQIADHLEYIQRCDRHKNDYTNHNNYPLLRIRYDDTNVENIILDFLVKHYDIDVWVPKEPVIIITD